MALHQCWPTAKKGIFRSKKAFLGESQWPVRRLSNQISSFRLETRQIFCFMCTNILLYYRIHGFLLTELTVRKAFQSYVFSLESWDSSNENTAFPSYLKGGFSLFCPLPCLNKIVTSKKYLLCTLSKSSLVQTRHYYLL